MKESARTACEEASSKVNAPVAVLKPKQLAQCVLSWNHIVLNSAVEDRAVMQRIDQSPGGKLKSELQCLT